MILAIDPGPEQSAVVQLDASRRVHEHGLLLNETLLEGLRDHAMQLTAALVVEEIESFGMPVGRETFRTVFWTGRFVEAWGGAFTLLPRRVVKLHLCHTARATDANIRQAIYDAYGGKLRAIGAKAVPGPLYGLKGHEYAALAVALTFSDQHTQRAAGPLGSALAER